MPEIYADPDYWYRLKDAVKTRNRGRCEYCSWRYGQDLHHRHYFTRRHERPRDVMLVCRTCHQVIHGFFKDSSEITVGIDSLAAKGDGAFGICFDVKRKKAIQITAETDTESWLEYLLTHPVSWEFA